MRTRDTSRDESAKDEDEEGAFVGSPLLDGLLAMQAVARQLLDVDDPLEGCDRLCRSITYGRVGDAAGTHTRAQCKAATVKVFGTVQTWPREWMGSSEYEREDGDDIEEEIESV